MSHAWTMQQCNRLLVDAAAIPGVMSSTFSERTAARAQLHAALKDANEFKEGGLPDKNALSTKLERLIESLLGKQLPGWTKRKSDKQPKPFKVGSGKEDGALFDSMVSSAQVLYDRAVSSTSTKAKVARKDKRAIEVKRHSEKWILVDAGKLNTKPQWIALSKKQRRDRVRLATHALHTLETAEDDDDDDEIVIPLWAQWNWEKDEPVIFFPDQDAVEELLGDERKAKRAKRDDSDDKEEEEEEEEQSTSQKLLAVAQMALSHAAAAAAPAAAAPAAAAPTTCTAPGCDCLLTRSQLLDHPTFQGVSGGKPVCLDCGHRIAIHP